jgi:hypothetical protein
MTTEYPQEPKPRHGDRPEEQPAPDRDVEREEPGGKSEAEMSPGKDWPHSDPVNRGKFDPATTRAPTEGQGQGS